MNRVATWFLLFVLIIPAPLYAAREITIGYQGIIESQGTLLDNTTGYFKFAICDYECVTTYWSNDNTSVAGSEPVNSISVGIVGGVFDVLLGDSSITNMNEIPSSVFLVAGDNTLYLRVWFNDGVNGSEQFIPDQRLSIVPYSVRTVMTGELINVGAVSTTGDLDVVTTATGSEDGVVFNARSVTGGAGVLIKVDNLSESGFALEIEDPTRTLFSVNENGSAFSRDIVLQSLTDSSDLNRVQTGRIFYDATLNRFMGCNNSACSEIGLAGSSGVADITSVTAGTGLSGGGTSGAVTMSVDTSIVVTKSGNHTMTGSLTASGLSATTVSATGTVSATDVTATGAISGSTLSLSSTATTGGVVMSPTGTGSGNTAEVQFKELAANGPHYVGFKAPDSILSNTIWTLPSAEGVSSGMVLETDGAGTLSWATDDNAGGDITAVTAGLGLSGGATSGIAGVAVGTGTGIQVNADNIELGYSDTLAADPVFTSGQAVFDSGDSQGGILFEGDTADTVETLLTVAEPTASDKTLTLPNATGTILINTNCVSVVAGEFNPTELGATDDYLNLVDNTFSATELDEDMFMVPVAMTARNLFAVVDVAPGVGNDAWAITLRDDAAGTTLTCSIDEAATSCSDTSNVPSIAAASKLDIQVISSGAGADPTAAAALTVSFCLGP